MASTLLQIRIDDSIKKESHTSSTSLLHTYAK